MTETEIMLKGKLDLARETYNVAIKNGWEDLALDTFKGVREAEALYQSVLENPPREP